MNSYYYKKIQNLTLFLFTRHAKLQLIRFLYDFLLYIPPSPAKATLLLTRSLYQRQILSIRARTGGGDAIMNTKQRAVEKQQKVLLGSCATRLLLVEE